MYLSVVTLNSMSLSKGNSIRFSLISLSPLLDASCVVSMLDTSKVGNVSKV